MILPDCQMNLSDTSEWSMRYWELTWSTWTHCVGLTVPAWWFGSKARNSGKFRYLTSGRRAVPSPRMVIWTAQWSTLYSKVNQRKGRWRKTESIGDLNLRNYTEMLIVGSICRFRMGKNPMPSRVRFLFPWCAICTWYKIREVEVR